MKDKMMNFDDFYSRDKFYFSEVHSGGMEECIKKYHVIPCKALDIGAGEGRNSLYLSSIGFDVIAVEPSFSGVQKIKETARKNNLNINVINTDIISAIENLSDIGFAVSLTSLEHMEYNYMCRAIAKIKQAMRIGGFIYIVAFTEMDPGFIKDHTNASECSLFIKHYFKKNELKDLFSDFEVLEYSEYIKEDTTHGPTHYHGKAKLFAKKTS